MPVLSARTFLACKHGEKPADCQDSIHPLPDNKLAFETSSYSVADGVATSFFSRNWARILTRRFGEGPQRVFYDWSRWLADAQDEWILEVERAAHSQGASFLVVNGLHAKRRAAATLVGLTILQQNAEGWTWRAAVLGDSCLFKLTKDGMVSSWNLKWSTEFTNLVTAAESRPSENACLPSQFGSPPHGDEPPIYESDSLLLATDALAKWLLKRQECGNPVWGTILGLETSNAFQLFVDQARLEVEQPLENDDVALVVLKFGEIHSIFAQQMFTPGARPESPGDPKLTQAPPHRLSEQLTIPTEPSPAIASKPDRRSPDMAAKSLFLALAFVLLMSVGLLASLLKTQSQLRYASNENETLREKLSAAAPAQTSPGTRVKLYSEELAHQTEVFQNNLQNVKVQLEPPPSIGEGLGNRDEFPAIEPRSQ
jgi:hypothetical protein